MASNTADPTQYQDPQRTREAERARAVEQGRGGRMTTQPAQPVTQPVAQPVTASPVAAVPTAQVVEAGDRVRWGPVWAGVITTFALFIVLELLGVGLGLISPTNGNSGVTSGISTLIAGLIAFFIGGWVAESSSGVRGVSSRLLTGFLVWALVTTLILFLSVVGLGTLFGALGAIAGQFAAAGRSVNVGSVNPAQVGNASRIAGWSAFIWLVISALAAMLGSLIGLPRRAHSERRW